MADIGYARVSTHSQKEDTQIDDLTAAGCERIFVDKGVSGKHAKRPELDKALEALQPGDNLVITRLSRAMRSLKHLLALSDDLDERGCGLKVLKQKIDTTTPQGRLTFHILASVDEFLRELIVEGTLEGLASARSRGNVGGRKRALNYSQREHVRRLVAESAAKRARGEKGDSYLDIAQLFGTSKRTILRITQMKEAA